MPKGLFAPQEFPNSFFLLLLDIFTMIECPQTQLISLSTDKQTNRSDRVLGLNRFALKMRQLTLDILLLISATVVFSRLFDYSYKQLRLEQTIVNTEREILQTLFFLVCLILFL